MKNFRKIIALFVFIFLTGIVVTVLTVNSFLNKSNSDQELIEAQKDTTYLLNAEQTSKRI